MQWFQIKEQSAGEKRLVLSWYLYKIFGEKALYFIAFLLSFFTLIFSPKVRFYSKKYFTLLYPYLKIKPSLINQFKHIYSYAKSLADKIILYCGDFNSENIIFKSENKEKLLKDIENKKGVFFICNHIGNIEILQANFLKNRDKYDFCVNFFMSNKQSAIFRSFLKKIQIDNTAKIFNIEDIGINTGVELKENLNKGDIVFIAGDRIGENVGNKNIEAKLFDQKIFLPKGAFRLAKLMKVPTYFISVIYNNNHYEVYFELQENLEEEKLYSSYVKFLEESIKINPFQFFHFYDFFEIE